MLMIRGRSLLILPPLHQGGKINRDRPLIIRLLTVLGGGGGKINRDRPLIIRLLMVLGGGEVKSIEIVL
jgi:hypothetical protein